MELPVDVYAIARWLGAEIKHTAGGRRSGSLDSREHLGRPVVYIRQTDAAVHRRFSVAHELGHLMLDPPGQYDRTYQDVQPSRRETRANNFAAELLMPEVEVRGWAHQWTVVPELLAPTFGVSKLAMLFRLKNLGLHP
jgi:Zn-dependent peptidase ImmA (M78 family)